jgi:hypothetical protein
MLIRVLFLVAFGLAAVAPVAADAQNRARRVSPPAPQALPSRAQFERGLMQSESGPLFAAIRRNFPVEAPAYFDGLYRVFSSNSRASNGALMQAVARAQFAFYASLVPHVRVAPDADLLRAVRARLALFEGLQRIDVALCGRLAAQGNAGPRLPNAIRQLNGQSIVTLIDAAGAGRRAPVPVRGPVTIEDTQVVGAAFAALDPTGDLLSLASGEVVIAAATPERACRYAIAIQRVALAVPQEHGAKLAVSLIEEALGRPAGL